MWQLNHKESWAPKNWCFWTVVLEKALESLLDSKEIQSVHPKGNQSWIFIARTDVEAETPILGPPHAKNWLIGTTEDEMVGWHHQLDWHEFEQAKGVGERQGSLTCCNPWGHKESDTTVWLNWTEMGIATHSSILAWRIPRTEEPGWLLSMGLPGFRHDRATITQHYNTKVHTT